MFTRFRRSVIAALVALVIVVAVCSLAGRAVQAVKAPTSTVLVRTVTAVGTIMVCKTEVEGEEYVSIIVAGDGWGDMDTFKVGE